MQKKYRVGLVVDNPKRDLMGMVFLGKKLVKLGFEVYIIPMNLIDYEIYITKPHYLLLPGFRKGSLKHYTIFHQYGIKLGILETEGGFYFKKEHRLNRIENSPQVNKIIENYFVWGQMFKELLLEKKAISSDKIFITGHPRMQLIKETPNTEMKGKNCILFCSSFASVGNDDKLKLDVIDILDKKGTTNAIEFYRGLDTMKKEFVDLAKLFDSMGFNVIYRPHPFEDFKSYKRKFTGTRIYLDDEKSTLPSLAKSFIHIHNSSTTSVEATLCGVPTIIPDYIENGYKVEASRNISYLAKSREDLINKIKLANKSNLKISGLSKNLKYVLDLDIDSSGKIAEIINKVELNNDIKVPKQTYKHDLNSFFKAIKSNPFSVYTIHKFLFTNKLTKWDNSYKAFTRDDIVTSVECNKLKIKTIKNSRSQLMLSNN